MVNSSETVGRDGGFEIRVSQDHHDSQPINKSNAELRKGIIWIQNRIKGEHSIELKW